MTEDDRILDLLGRALRETRTVEVPEERARALREQVLLRNLAPHRRRPFLGTPPRWIRRGVAAIAALLLFAGGLSIGHSPPDSLRDLAKGMGLAVESSTLIAARHELNRLGEALASSDQADIKASDACMLAHVMRLDAEEKAAFVPVAHEVHVRAEQFLEARGDQVSKPGCRQAGGPRP